MTFDETRTDRWSPGGQIMAWVLVAEIVMALLAISFPEFHQPRVLVIASAAMIGSAVIAGRAQMPVQPKALLIAGICAALLALAAAQDPFGLRAVDRSIEDATRETHAAAQVTTADTPVFAQTASQVTLRGKGDPTATAFANDLAANVAMRVGNDIGPYRIDGEIDVTTGAAGDTYRLTWRLGGPAESRWCGRIVATGQARAAVLDSFGTTIAAALRRSRAGSITCG